MLKLPKVLTCPEYNDFKKQVNQRKIPTRAEVNIADHIRNPQDSSLESSNSCCSILLDVVNKTNKKVNEDLHRNQYSEKQCEQLDKLLKKIDEIRKILVNELSKCKPSSDKEMKNAVDSVVSVIKERQEILKKNKASSKKPVESDSAESSEVVMIKSPKKKKVSRKEPTGIDSTESVEVKHPLKKPHLYDCSSSTNYMSPPERVLTSMDQKCDKRDKEKKRHAEAKKDEENLKNPELMPYIQRLLGMTRTSINALGLSSSSVTTPNSSTIAIESNVDGPHETTPNSSPIAIESNVDGPHETTKREEDINEKYAFIERMRQQILTSPQMEGFSKRLTKNWEDNLNNVSPPKSESPISQNDKSPEANTTGDTAKIDRLSETVQQRIRELHEMIMKVREEKQKILHSTIPCAFEEEELQVAHRKSILKKNVPMSLSRDSGLSSRPPSTQPLESSPG